jgi:transposase-like protein
LTGPGGLLKALTKTVLETALEEEMSDHLGYDKHDPMGRNRGNSSNGGAVQDGADRDRPGRD